MFVTTAHSVLQNVQRDGVYVAVDGKLTVHCRVLKQ